MSTQSQRMIMIKIKEVIDVDQLTPMGVLTLNVIKQTLTDMSTLSANTPSAVGFALREFPGSENIGLNGDWLLDLSKNHFPKLFA